MKPRIHSPYFVRHSVFLVILVMSLMMVSCGGGRDSGVYVDPTREIPVIEPEPEFMPSEEEGVASVTTPATAEEEIEPEFFQGWIITQADKTTSDWVEQMENFQINHVQIGGGLYETIDDLIFEGEERDRVQSLIQQFAEKEAEIYLWSRELSIDSPRFRFHPQDPKLVARKSAYRSVLEQFPQVEGIVLTFAGASVPPWEAEHPDSRIMSQKEKIAFVIQSIKELVVDELGKRLWVRTQVDSRAVESLVASVADSMEGDDIGWVVPFREAETWRTRLDEFAVMIEMSPGEVTTRPTSQEWERFSQLRDEETIDGVALFIQSSPETPEEAIQAFDVYVFSQWMNHPHKSREELLQQWISEQYGWLPTSWEGYSMQRILRTLQKTREEMRLVKGVYDFSEEGESLDDPLSADLFEDSGENTRFDRLEEELEEPSKQTLVDLAQESVEVIEELDQAIELLGRLKQDLRSGDYDELRARLEHQRQMALVFHYAKQCYWGYLFWKKLWDEEEALHLEAHLQQMEQLADEWEESQETFHLVEETERIRSFVDSIREEFPRVILGEKEREWNRIYDVVVNQTGPNSLEIKWKTEQVSTSRVFITEKLPIFTRFETALEYPDTEHQCVIRDLKPGRRYCFKLQTITEDGEVTNSKVIFFEFMTAEV